MLDINELKRNVTTKLAFSNQDENTTATRKSTENTLVPNDKNSSQLAMIGPSIHFKGELTGEEGLIIDGSIEGTIDLKGNQLIVGENGNIKADVYAKTIKVNGYLKGELHGVEKVHISHTGEVTGNIFSPKVVIEEGAKFKGSIDMTQKHNSNNQPGNSSTDSIKKQLHST
jgi:cytoskeletal protein CcmA (bactofilin family)